MSESFPRQFARTRRFTLGEPRSFTICAQRVLFLRALAGGDPRTGLWSLDLDTGEGTPGEERLVVDPRTLGDDADLPAAERARRERVRETAAGVVAYATDDLGRTVAFAASGELWVVDVEAGEPRRLPAAAGAYDPRPDPSGRHVAYVSGRELRVIGVDGSEDRCVAVDPHDDVSWGRAEFAAAEEMDRQRGYWWAPDGSSLLVARVDEREVPVWWIADPAHPDRAPTAVRYPVAGAANADVTLHVVPLDGSEPTEIRWDRNAFPYLGRASWSVGHPPLLQVQSRDQRATQILVADPATGRTELVVADADDVWVELFPGVPAWSGDEVVRIADVDHARRLYVGDEAVTPPGLHVRSVCGADEDAVVFTAYDGEPSEIHVFRWSRTGVERLTTDAGVHGAMTGKGALVLSAATLAYDGSRHIVRTKSGDHAVTSCPETPSLTPDVRLLRLGARRLPAGLLLPRDHRPGTKLPVLLDPYGGPHAQMVLTSRRMWLESQWWADQGFAVLVADGRGTPGVGPAWERSIHRNVADVVLEDQVDALTAAAAEVSDLDLSRVAIRGWSFGGYLAALAVLRRPDVFHAAVAGAPSASWNHYDTHYTERYVGMPQDDPDLYRRMSLLDDAPNLTRPLLLIHGLADDNVVAAHTLLLSQRLTEAGRPHTVLPLTGVTHMTPQESVAENLLLLQRDFLYRELGMSLTA
jgi:dipeptidyl-peptidase 4